MLTGLPLRPRITATDGLSIVKQIRERLTLITPSVKEYISALGQASSGLSSVELRMTHSLLIAP